MPEPRPKSVKVLIYFTKGHEAMACVLEQEWRGPVRLDRRLSRTVPIRDAGPCPRGVPENVWLAHCFLSQVIWDYVDAQAEADLR